MILNFFESLYRKNQEGLSQELDSSKTIEEKAIDGVTEPPSPKSVRLESAPAGIMAYMGDGVYELMIRNFFVQRGLWDSHKIHRQVIQFVNAGAQAALLRHIEPHLTEQERQIMRRARNSNAGNVPRNAKVSDYRYSTAFEAVLGYTLLHGDIARLEQFKAMIEEYLIQHISGR